MGRFLIRRGYKWPANFQGIAYAMNATVRIVKSILKEK